MNLGAKLLTDDDYNVPLLPEDGNRGWCGFDNVRIHLPPGQRIEIPEQQTIFICRGSVEDTGEMYGLYTSIPREAKANKLTLFEGVEVRGSAGPGNFGLYRQIRHLPIGEAATVWDALQLNESSLKQEIYILLSHRQDVQPDWIDSTDRDTFMRPWREFLNNSMSRRAALWYCQGNPREYRVAHYSCEWNNGRAWYDPIRESLRWCWGGFPVVADWHENDAITATGWTKTEPKPPSIGAVLLDNTEQLQVDKWETIRDDNVRVSFGGYYCGTCLEDAGGRQGLHSGLRGPCKAASDTRGSIIVLVECAGLLSYDDGEGRYRWLRRLSPEDARTVWPTIKDDDEGCPLDEEIEDCAEFYNVKTDWL